MQMFQELLTSFGAIEEPRQVGKVDHLLIDVLAITVCVVLAHAETYEDIALYGKYKEKWLRQFLELPNGIPSHDTFRRVFMLVESERFETAMILNHKAAISKMLDGLDEDFPDSTSAQRRHVLMMRDLLDPADLGAVRKTEMSISATSYRPSSDRIVLSIGLTELFVKAAQVDDPLEASFFLLAGMSYLKAFADGNKRMGRLFSSEPLLRAAMPPLSFVGIDKTPYILGLIEFYETGNTELLGEAIAESYEITASQYIQSIHTQRVPRALELRERVRVDDALGAIFLGLLRDDEIPELVDQVFQDLSQEDRVKMVEILVEKADRSSPEAAFLYGVEPDQIEARNLANRHPGLCLKCRVDPSECNDGPGKP